MRKIIDEMVEETKRVYNEMIKATGCSSDVVVPAAFAETASRLTAAILIASALKNHAELVSDIGPALSTGLGNIAREIAAK